MEHYPKRRQLARFTKKNMHTKVGFEFDEKVGSTNQSVQKPITALFAKKAAPGPIPASRKF